MKLRGKTALITGATGVIGKAIAKALAQEECNLILCGQSINKINALKKEFADFKINKIAFIKVDVSNKKLLKQFFNKIKKDYRTVDILVTAAGTYGAIGHIEQIEPEEWMRAINVNLLGTFMTIKYALPLLRTSKRPKIITFAGGGEGPLFRRSSYVSSKGGVLRMIETLANEMAPIEINAVSPGFIVSGLIDEIIKAGPQRIGQEKYREAIEQQKIQKKSLPLEKTAALAVFLASSESNGISGKNISAVWDKWQDFPKYKKEIMKSDIYNIRRIKPKDRGYNW